MLSKSVSLSTWRLFAVSKLRLSPTFALRKGRRQRNYNLTFDFDRALPTRQYPLETRHNLR